MKSNSNVQLSKEEAKELLKILKSRFEKNMHRHKGMDWDSVQRKFESKPDKIFSLNEMEMTGGEPDVVVLDKKAEEIFFIDCSPETPKGRVSVCYDREGLESRKEHRPSNSAIDLANEMGIEILSEDEYRQLQKLEKFDAKTSSWLKTPAEIRKLGGAIFGDFRYGHVFIYHNGAQSYYAARAFRGKLKI